MKKVLGKAIAGKVAELEELCGKAGMSVTEACEQYGGEAGGVGDTYEPMSEKSDGMPDEEPTPGGETPAAAAGDEGGDKAQRKALVVAALRKKMG